MHQVELEMQIEGLQRTQLELDAARSRYFDLYELAPVGYCTLSENGLILEANLSISIMLGVPKGELLGQPISRFICKEDQDIYYRYRIQFLIKEMPQKLELRMVKKDDTVFWGHLTSTLTSDVDGLPFFRVVLTNILSVNCPKWRYRRARLSWPPCLTQFLFRFTIKTGTADTSDAIKLMRPKTFKF